MASTCCVPFDCRSSVQPIARLAREAGRTPAARRRCRVSAAATAGRARGLFGVGRSSEGFKYLQTSAEAILTTFTFPAALARSSVEITGTFTDWERTFSLRSMSDGDDLVRSIVLPPGPVQYKYVVDGKVWRHSPRDPITIDPNGAINNRKAIGVNAVITWQGRAREVFASGSFLAWQELVPLQKSSSGEFYVNCCLPNGKHHIRFLVDGEWEVRGDLPVETDDAGETSNVLSVNSRDSFHIFAHTAWTDGVVHHRILDADFVPVTDDSPLGPTPTRLGPWQACSVPALRDHADSVLECQLEFYIEGPHGDQDRPLHEQTYLLPSPGGYKLSSGTLRPFPQACEAPFMLVSDVDGTMIDEDDFAQRAAGEFREYWEASAALCGSILVYNTGRSIGQLTGLLGARRDCMAVPDAIVTAVGTKVFLLNRKISRSNASTDAWEEDMGWSALLDVDWDIDVVRGAVERCICDRVHWLDRGTEHPHRVAVSVHRDAMHGVVDSVRREVEGAGCLAQFITSGMGEYRYLDVLSIAGGKRNAMEYVRAIYGIPKQRVVAAGDSGNDILMLEGNTKAIVVGNAQPALLDWAVLQEQTSGRVVLTDAPLAKGLMEGLARHGFY